MPTATAPLPKPGAKPAKPGVKTGGAKTGAAKPGAKAKKKPVEEVIEEDEVKPTHPTVLVVTVIALLVALFFVYQQYSVDTTFGRITEPTFGWPADGSEGGSDAAVEEEATEEEAADEEGGEEEEASDEEE